MKEPNKSTRIENGQAVMTFEEIGLALGFKRAAAKRNAFMIYKGAMQKIRNRPDSIRALRELVNFRNAQRGSMTLPNWEI